MFKLQEKGVENVTPSKLEEFLKKKGFNVFVVENKKIPISAWLKKLLFYNKEKNSYSFTEGENYNFNGILNLDKAYILLKNTGEKLDKLVIFVEKGELEEYELKDIFFSYNEELKKICSEQIQFSYRTKGVLCLKKFKLKLDKENVITVNNEKIEKYIPAYKKVLFEIYVFLNVFFDKEVVPVWLGLSLLGYLFALFLKFYVDSQSINNKLYSIFKNEKNIDFGNKITTHKLGDKTVYFYLSNYFDENKAMHIIKFFENTYPDLNFRKLPNDTKLLITSGKNTYTITISYKNKKYSLNFVFNNN